jgi:hypothetical protein
VVSFPGPALTTKRARITLELDQARRLLVQADRNLLEALFSILIGNAPDAIAAEGMIGARCRRPSAELVEIVMADDGRGIAESDMPHICEPFFTTKGPGKGAGLGLAIARNIVLDHGGWLRLENGFWAGRGSAHAACYTGAFGDGNLRNRSGLACPYCCSSDIWQPRVRTWVDSLVERFGWAKYECRKCRRLLFLKTERRERREAPEGES